jgi:hypothetical protein
MKRQLEEEKSNLIETKTKLAKKQHEVSNAKTQYQSLNACINLIIKIKRLGGEVGKRL